MKPKMIRKELHLVQPGEHTTRTKARRQEEPLQARTWVRPDTQGLYTVATVLINEKLHVTRVHMKGKKEARLWSGGMRHFHETPSWGGRCCLPLNWSSPGV